MEPKEEQKMEAPAAQPKQKKSMVGQFLMGVFIVVIIAIVGLYAYTKSQVAALSESSFVVSSASILHTPIAKINGHSIAYSEFMTDYQSLKNFYSQQDQSQQPVTDNDISEQVISRLLVNTLMEKYAKQYDVTVEQSDIDAAKAELLSQFPDEDTAAQEIQNTFGWSLDTFTTRVIDPIVVEQKVGEAFSSDETVDDMYKAPQVNARHILFAVNDEQTEDQAKEKAEEVLARIQGGEGFAELAAEFGEDGTSETGGDLGWIDRGTTVPEFEDVIFSMNAGELYPEVVQTQFGYHIVQVDDVRTVNDFAAFFQDQLKDADIKIYSDIANPFASSTDDDPAADTQKEGEDMTQ